MPKKETICNTSIETIWNRLSRSEKIFSFMGGILFTIIIILAILNSHVEVSSEFSIGLLSANGILLGFWGVIVGMSHYGNKKLWSHKHSMKTGLFGSLALLCGFVFVLFLNALHLVSSVVTLCAGMFSFYWTLIFLGTTLYYGVFSD
jgi:hypothetical protein